MEQKKFDPVRPEDLRNQARIDELPSEQRAIAVGELQENAEIENADRFSDLIEREQDPEQKQDLEKALEVANAIQAAGGRALVVGGYARDTALNKFGHNVKPKDIDIEVYGLSFEELQKVLEPIGQLDVVGAAFGVVKLKNSNLDISIPRRDSKTGVGHKGFTIEGDPNMTVREAAKRRDFTINALALDPLTGEILDYYGGINDIKNKTLRCTDEELFKDDSLRILRAAQFASRFNFSIDQKVYDIAKQLNLKELPKERVGEEWLKLLLKSEQPSVGLEASKELGIIDQLHPELQALFDTPQEPEWHPEGDVWIHTKMVVDSAAKILRENPQSEEDKLVVLLAALCHDLGKPATTTFEEGRIKSKGHAEAGVEPTISLLKSWNISHQVIEKVVPIVVDHLFPSVVRNPTHAAVRRLANRLHPATIQQLVLVGMSDHMGRGFEWKGYPEGDELLAAAREVNVQDGKPKALLMGRDAIAAGVKPGREMGQLLRRLYDMQLEGRFTTHEEAVKVLEQVVKSETIN